MTQVSRETRESLVRLDIRPGAGQAAVATGERFLDHMLATLARYAALDLEIEARADLRHHLVEDVAIALGSGVARLVSERAARYGAALIPMDDALVQAAVDLGGRPWYRGPIPSSLYEHWMRSFSHAAGATVHLRVLRGTDRHHIVEAAFKALGLSLRQALVQEGAVFSTKGAVSLRVT